MKRRQTKTNWVLIAGKSLEEDRDKHWSGWKTSLDVNGRGDTLAFASTLWLWAESKEWPIVARRLTELKLRSLIAACAAPTFLIATHLESRQPKTLCRALFVDSIVMLEKD